MKTLNVQSVNFDGKEDNADTNSERCIDVPMK